jgi:hypothetical protein
MKSKNLYVVGVIFSIFLLLIFNVKADDNNGSEFESELGDFGVGIGIAGFVLFGLAAFSGLLIFLNQQKQFREIFKPLNINIKIIYKIHHPLTLLALFTCGIHAIIAISEGYGGLNTATIVGYVGLFTLGLIVISGFLFKIGKGVNRSLLRGFHLALMISILIFFAIHTILFD